MNYINKIYWGFNFFAKILFFIGVAKFLNHSEFVNFNIITSYSDQILLLVSCTTQIYFLRNKFNKELILGNALLYESILLVAYYGLFIIFTFHLTDLSSSAMAMVFLLSMAKTYVQILHRYSTCYLSFGNSIKNTLICESVPILIAIIILNFNRNILSVVLTYSISSILMSLIYNRRIQIKFNANRKFIFHYGSYALYAVLILSTKNIEKIILLEKYEHDIDIVNYIFYSKLISVLFLIYCGYIDAKFFNYINSVKDITDIKDELRSSLINILKFSIVATFSVFILPILPLLNIKTLEESTLNYPLFWCIFFVVMVQQFYILCMHVYELFFKKKFLYIRVLILYLSQLILIVSSNSIITYVYLTVFSSIFLCLIDFILIRKRYYE